MNLTLRAKKNLEPLQLYRPGPSESATLPLGRDEELLGVYENPESLDSTIVFTQEAVHVQAPPEEWTRIPYGEIRTVKLADDQDKENASLIAIRTSDGATHDLHFAGGSGRFRDVYGVHRFLRGACR